jgi:hypothetical protein
LSGPSDTGGGDGGTPWLPPPPPPLPPSEGGSVVGSVGGVDTPVLGDGDPVGVDSLGLADGLADGVALDLCGFGVAVMSGSTFDFGLVLITSGWSGAAAPTPPRPWSCWTVTAGGLLGAPVTWPN